MRVLLDTHTFLWIEENHPSLSTRVFELIRDRTHDIFLSHVSIWEIQIKLSVGKLSTKLPLNERVALAQSTNGLGLLPIEPDHIYTLNDLPFHHRDPFDRLLIAQAIHEGLPTLSKDEKFQAYPIQLVW